MIFPKMYKIKQHFDETEIKDVYLKTFEELGRICLEKDIKGKKIGITAGSRGIKNVDKIYKAAIDYVRTNGGFPYLIATMGSHGGGSVEGQLAILKELGVTEQTMDCPILSSVHADKIGETPDGIPAYINEKVKEVDKIIIINRIKEHTDFSAIIESGLHKMMTIGLGTLEGADSAHINAMKYSYFHTITEVGKIIKDYLDIVCGIGIVENALCNTHH